MNQVRLHGNPFAADAVAGQLRGLVRLCADGSGITCALSLAKVSERPPLPGEQVVSLTDGVRNWSIPTGLPPAEIELLLGAAVGKRVAASAPVVVFCSDDEQRDAVRLAGLEWPEASAVIAAPTSATAADLLRRVGAELRWAGVESLPHARTLRDVRPYLELVAATLTPTSANAGATIVHVADGSFAAGTDLVCEAFARRHADQSNCRDRLRVVLPTANARTIEALRETVRAFAIDALEQHVEFVAEELAAGHFADAAAIVQPMRTFDDFESRVLVLALASGRPVCASRFAATASVLGGRSVVHPIGGRNVVGDARNGSHFAPHPSAVAAALLAACQEPSDAMGERARDHVVGRLVQDRPCAPPPPLLSLRDPRPTVVLEAPFLETSSSAELTIATARALLARGLVDLRLVPVAPFEHDLAWLRRRAPELEAHLCRTPGKVDLWLSSGWPVRAARPNCRHWSLRVDWEYGALPIELTPHVSEDADSVVVHSESVYRVITAAGRPMSSVHVVPHGVDEEMHDAAQPDAEVVAFKGDLPAVLFCGGLVWRKGFDAYIAAALHAWRQGRKFVLVVKDVGGQRHYGTSQLGALVKRLQSTPGAPPVLHIDRDVSRAELASIYTACDVLLHPFRGEGFGLPALEARACGLPIAVTSGGPADAFMHGDSAHGIDSARRPVDLPGAHVSQPWVFEPSVEDAASKLVQILDDLPAQRTAARVVAPALRQAFCWEQAAESLEDLALAGQRLRRHAVVAGAEPVVLLPATARMGSSEPGTGSDDVAPSAGEPQPPVLARDDSTLANAADPEKVRS
ncbi:MAG: glycosyltransferase [Planctomycetota bacterium]